jgi:hypothetical protein
MKMNRPNLRTLPEMMIQDSRPTRAWFISILLAVAVLIPYLAQWLWPGMGEGTWLPALFLLGGCGWLFIMTWFIIQLDDHAAMPAYLDFLSGRLINLSVVTVWLGFILIPLIGLLLRPERPLYWLTTAYLVMGLANLLFKLNRQKAFHNWLKISNVAPGEVRVIHDIGMIEELGLYVLAVRPWWILKISLKGIGCVVQVLESEGESLVDIAPGKRRMKYLANWFFALDWIAKQLNRFEQGAS